MKLIGRWLIWTASYLTIVPTPATPADSVVLEANRQVKIVVDQSSNVDEVAAWLAYAMALAKRSNIEASSLEGNYVPSFEAEYSARADQIEIWRELTEKKPRHVPFMDAMVGIFRAGYLKEYVWYYYRTSNWGAAPKDLRMGEFERWRSVNLAGHVPQTRAHLVFVTTEKAAR